MEPVFGKKDAVRLTFIELAELVIVARFRRSTDDTPQISLDRLRTAHRFAREKLQIEYPFASEKLKLEGGHIMHMFEGAYPGPGKLAVDMNGNHVLPLSVRDALNSFQYDSLDHLAMQWFPHGRDVPIVLDPERGAGLPVIRDRNLRVDFLFGRWKNGEDIDSLAEDYQLDRNVVEAALRVAA